MRINAGSLYMGGNALSVEIPRTLNPLEVYIALVVRMRGIIFPMLSLFISAPVKILILREE